MLMVTCLGRINVDKPKLCGTISTTDAPLLSIAVSASTFAVRWDDAVAIQPSVAKDNFLFFGASNCSPTVLLCSVRVSVCVMFLFVLQIFLRFQGAKVSGDVFFFSSGVSSVYFTLIGKDATDPEVDARAVGCACLGREARARCCWSVTLSLNFALSNISVLQPREKDVRLNYF